MPQTDQSQLLKSIAAFLRKRKIPYMITGAWSVIYYARPRASHDIDFVVELYKEDIPKITRAFKTLSHDFLIDTKSIEEAIRKKDMFTVVHLYTLLKLDFWMLNNKDSFDLARFQRRKVINLLGENMSIATAEDTILKKLLWYKKSKIEKHLIDSAFVHKIQKKNLDLAYLKSWAVKLEIEDLLKQLPKINIEEHL